MYKIVSMIKNVIRPLLKIVARKKLSSLVLSNDSDISKLSNAILEALNNEFDTYEMEWINKIEAIRNRLKKDTSVISVTDYGAGKPGDERTEEEMEKGVNFNSTVADISKASKPQFWASILFKLIRYFKATNVLELGTCVGISGAYLATAQVLNDGDNYMLTTLEGSESTANLAKNNFKMLGFDKVNVVTGRFDDTLDAILNANYEFDCVFIDGHHDEQATIRYFDKIRPKLSEKALVIFDDISWSEGMKRAWKKIVSNEHVGISIDLRTIGICILRSDSSDKFSSKIYLV